jgi:hypothetical protein
MSIILVHGKQQKSISLQSVPKCFSQVLQPSQPSLQAKTDNPHGDANGDGNPFSFVFFTVDVSI